MDGIGRALARIIVIVFILTIVFYFCGFFDAPQPSGVVDEVYEKSHPDPYDFLDFFNDVVDAIKKIFEDD